MMIKLIGVNGGIDMIYSQRATVHRHGVDFMRHKTGFTRLVFETIATENNFDVDIKEIDFDLVIDIKKY